MSRRTGSADLPLHGGRVPAWLGERMTKLGTVITEAIVLHYGRDEFLRRLAHPFWFQSFGAVMGMDWHSSGITTSVLGALKRGLSSRGNDLGIYVCGGRGAQSRKTPHELLSVAERTGFDGHRLAATSRLVAKIDSAAVQDGFNLYLHGFITTSDAKWVVVQQGMDPDRGQARRYHWHSEGLTSFLDDPHTAIEGRNAGLILNLADSRAQSSRAAQLELLGDLGPDKIVRELIKIERGGSRVPLVTEQQMDLPHLVMPMRHNVEEVDVNMRRLHANLAAAAEVGPQEFQDLLRIPGVGPRTVTALAMVAEVIHGAPSRFSDPARYSLAHGGKDRHPFPVPIKVYDETLRVMKSAVRAGKLGREEELLAIHRLDEQARRLERYVTGPDLKEIIAGEIYNSHNYGGRSIFGNEPKPELDTSEIRDPIEQRSE